MARKSMTYGNLPSFEEFENAFDSECESVYFRFVNDKRVGTDKLTCSELWNELAKAKKKWENDENVESGDWCSCVLGVLGFEWI